MHADGHKNADNMRADGRSHTDKDMRPDPIVAIATASGRGAVGIVRVSGHDLAALTLAICGRALEPRRATHLPFLSADGAPIDHGLALHFPAPHSYTGESVLELQAHGGPIVLQLLLARCLEAAAELGSDPLRRTEDARTGAEAGTGPAGGSERPGSDDDGARAQRLPRLRLARPGEFTERAFLNDKIDLAQAEAVGDLIEASTEAAARSASRSLAGAFSTEIDGLRDRLVELRMLVEATLDFPDEELDFLERAGAVAKLAATREQVDAVLARARQGALLRDGIRVVLAGQPNVGKSSLLNALAGAELAIVSAVPGTTRDRIGETIQIEGVPVHVVDTAGLRESADAVEQLGIARSWQAIEAADAIVFLHDLTRLGEPAYQAGDAAIASRLPMTGPVAGRVLHVFNKADAVPGRVDDDGDDDDDNDSERLAVSALSGSGLDALRRRLLEMAGWHAQAEGVFIARARHVDALLRTRDHLDRARSQAARGDSALELLAEELRSAHDALGEITGAFSSDDLLGVIFGAFCIGK